MSGTNQIAPFEINWKQCWFWYSFKRFHAAIDHCGIGLALLLFVNSAWYRYLMIGRLSLNKLSTFFSSGKCPPWRFAATGDPQGELCVTPASLSDYVTLNSWLISHWLPFSLNFFCIEFTQTLSGGVRFRETSMYTVFHDLQFSHLVYLRCLI